MPHGTFLQWLCCAIMNISFPFIGCHGISWCLSSLIKIVTLHWYCRIFRVIFWIWHLLRMLLLKAWYDNKHRESLLFIFFVVLIAFLISLLHTYPHAFIFVLFPDLYLDMDIGWLCFHHLVTCMKSQPRMFRDISIWLVCLRPTFISTVGMGSTRVFSLFFHDYFFLHCMVTITRAGIILKKWAGLCK